MFYTELVVPAWSYLIPFLVLVGVCYAMGARWLENHLITFFPEVGNNAIAGEEEARLRGEFSHLRLVWPKKEEAKKAA